MTGLRRVPASSPPVAPTWAATPNALLSEDDVGSTNILAYVNAGNIATDVIALVSGSLPTGLLLPPPGNLLTYDGSQTPGVTGSIVYGVSRSGGAVVNSPTAAITIEEDTPVVPAGAQKATYWHPEGPNVNLNGDGKHFVLGANPGDNCIYLIGGDYTSDFNAAYPGVATAPTEQDGQQYIWKIDVSGKKPVMTNVQPYWPAYADTNGWLFWNPDDAGGVWCQCNGTWEFLVFRSTGVITAAGEPIVGRFNYPGSGSGAGLVGDLVNTTDDPYIGAWNPATGAWRQFAPMPPEMASNRCWGGVYDAPTNTVFWIVSDRRILSHNVNTGAETTPRHTGTNAAAVMGSTGVLDVPNTCRWQTARGFIADHTDGSYGRSVFVWDTSANARLIAISISRYFTWNAGTGTFSAGLPAVIYDDMPPTCAAISTQENTSLTYDASTDLCCVWDTTLPGYLYTRVMADGPSGSWTTQGRVDFKWDNGGGVKFAQRQVYSSLLEKTLCFGFGIFDNIGGFQGRLEEFDAVFIDLQEDPTWFPTRGEVQPVMGAGVTGNTSTLATRIVANGDGDWNWNGNTTNRFMAYSSFIYNQWGIGRYGDYVGAYVGGDFDWLGPDGYRCLLEKTTAPTYAMFCRPYNVPGITVNTGTPASSVISTTADITLSEYLTLSGVTPSPHTYGNQVIVPPTTSFPNGSLVNAYLKFCWGPGGSTNVSHKADLGAPDNSDPDDVISRAVASPMDSIGAADGASCYDYFNDRVIIIPTGSSSSVDADSWRILSARDSNNVFQTVTTVARNCAVNSLRGDPTLLYWFTAEVSSGVRTRKHFGVMFGRHQDTGTNTFQIQLYDLDATGGATAQWPVSLNYVGGARTIPDSDGPYVSFRRRDRSFYLRLGALASHSSYENTLWKITPPGFGLGDPRTDDWDISEITMPGATVTVNGAINGGWNGMAVVEPLNCLIWQNLPGDNTWVYGFDD